MSLIKLLPLCLIICPGGLCLDPEFGFDAVWWLPKPQIPHLEVNSAKQILLVSWLVNHRSWLEGTYELQIGRTKNYTIVYSKNITVLNLGQHSWTWTSDLPLECADHSVRIRYFYNQTVLSPWSNWTTNFGAQPADKAKIFPFQRVLREGDSAMFCCVPSHGDHVSDITLNDKKYPLINVGTAVRAISVQNLTIPTFVSPIKVHCDSQRPWSVWNYVSFPSQKPRNLSCVTSDLKTISCSWDSGRKRNLHDRNNQMTMLHIQNSGLSPVVCQPSSCTFQAVPHLEEYSISVVVKDQLGEENESYCFSIRDRVVPVVKWNGVIPGVTTTNLSWIIQGDLPMQTFLCQVNTVPAGSSKVSSATIGSCFSAWNDAHHSRRICEDQLKNLSPGCRYSVRLRCSVTGELWGPWTQPVSFKTDPLVVLDVWRKIKQQFEPHVRQLTLLWMPHISGSDLDLTIRGYVIEWPLGDRKWRDGRETWAEFFIGPERYDITVSAVLHTGANVSAHITVPPMHDGGGEPSPVERRLCGFADGAAFNLSWDKQELATCGYTVEWCSLESKVSCALQWKKVPAGSNMLSLPAGNFKAGSRFTFNIYGCTENGHKLLEIQMGYTQELQSVEAPILVKSSSESSSVTLEWHYDEDDEDHPAFITGYLVKAHEAQWDTQDLLVSVSVSDPRRKSVTIDGLQPSREYVLSVSALTGQGPGQASSMTIRTKANYSAHLLKIFTPILLLLCIAILLWLRRKVVKTRLVEIFAYPAGMNIRAPDLDHLLQEMVKRLHSCEVEECKESNIEILRTGSFPEDDAETEVLSALSSRPSPTEALLAHIPVQAGYFSQLAPALTRGLAHQPVPSSPSSGYLSQ